MKSLTLVLFCFGLSFSAETQKAFNFSDTAFVIGQLHQLKHLRYGMGGLNQMIIDSLTLTELDSLVQFLERNRTLSIEIGVHTDHRGSDSMNLKITQFRSEDVKNYLVSRGISSTRITAKGYGETQLIVPQNETDKYKKTDKVRYETLHQRNRRTEIRITGT